MSIATSAEVMNSLQLTDDQVAALRKSQEKALAKFRSKAQLTPEERVMGRGIELEEHHRKTGNKDGLAEALAMQGRYAEAAAIAVKEEHRANLLEMADAIESPDDDCECPTYTEVDDLFIPNQFVQSRVMTKRGLLPAIRCQICKKLNVRPELPHLAEQHAARQSSVNGKEVKATEFFKTK